MRCVLCISTTIHCPPCQGGRCIDGLLHAVHVFGAVAGLHQTVKVNTSVLGAVVGRGAEQGGDIAAKGGKALCDGKKRSRRGVIFRRLGVFALRLSQGSNTNHPALA